MTDTITKITDHPVEQGATITDHAEIESHILSGALTAAHEAVAAAEQAAVAAQSQEA